MARICIVGTGYVGLCTGVVFAERGHEVTFVDLAPEKLASLREGKAPFYEPGLEAALQRVLGVIRTSTSIAAEAPESEFIFLCVGTPGRPDGSIDLSYVENAAKDVGSALAGRSSTPIVVTKSTVVPGTTRRLVVPALRGAAGREIPAASNPEFLKEGSALVDARAPDRIVVGSDRPEVAERVLALYDALPGERMVVGPDTAEMIKYAANAFLATKIALTNELANVCERVGVDWSEVARGIGADRRIGPLFLRAGVGFGGSCFPKDVAAIARVAEDAGVPSGLLDAVIAHNERQPTRVLDLLRDELGTLDGKRIALLGLAFKPDTDDVRETRALPIWLALSAAGATVVCHDPRAGPAFQRLEPRAKVVGDVAEALLGADGAVLQTEWPEYRALAPSAFPPVVVDGRRSVDAARLRAAGVRYRAIGLGEAPST